MLKSETPIPPIESNPEYARQAGILRLLTGKHIDLERNLDWLRLEIWFSTHTPKPDSTRDQDAWAWLQELRAAQPSQPVEPDSEGVPLVVARALELLRGEISTQTDSFAAQFERTEADIRVIKAGIAAQSEIVNGIRDNLSLALRRSLVPLHNETLRAGLVAALALAAAADAVTRRHADLIKAGYEVHGDMEDLCHFPLHLAVLLGSPMNPDSAISHMRRKFESRGIGA